MPNSRSEWEEFQVWIYENHSDGTSYLNDLRPSFDGYVKKTIEELYADCEKAQQQSPNSYYAIKAYTAFRLSKEETTLNPLTYSMIRQLYQDDIFMIHIGRILCDGDLIYCYNKKTKVFSKVTQNDFFEFYIHRRNAIKRWSNCRTKTIAIIIDDVFSEHLKNLSLSAIRCRIADLGKTLQKKWSDIPKFKGSRVDQLLYQMQSLQYHQGWKNNEVFFDWFYDFPQLKEYMVELLVELFISVIQWDGKTFLHPQIMGIEDNDQLLPVLVTVPLTRILTDSALLEIVVPKSESVHPKDVGCYRTPEIVRLLRAGIIWINTFSRNKYAPIERMPVQIKTNESKEILTELFAEIWKEKSPSLDILRSFLESTSRLQLSRLWKVCNPNDKSDDISAIYDLEALLDSSPPIDSLTYNKEIVQALVQVIVNINYGHMLYGSTDQGLTANKNLLSIYCKKPHEIAYAWKRLHTRPSAGRPSELNLCDTEHLDVLLFFLRHIHALTESLVQETSTNLDQMAYYTVCAQMCFYQTIDLAAERDLPKLAQESVCIYIQIMTSIKDCRISSTVAHETIVMDYFLSCKEAFELCRERISIPPSDTFEAFFESAITLYNESLRKFFDENVSLKSLEYDWFAIKPNIHEQQKNIYLWASQKLKKSNRPVEILIPQSVNRRGLHRKWFLAGLDSAALSTYESEKMIGGINSVEARLEGHLLRLQDVVLTCPQLVDSKLMRQLVNTPEFLWMIRTGRISCSFYGNIYNLRLYVAQQMEKTYGAVKEGKTDSAFLWSSLPPEFNQDDTARQDAAAYMRGEISYSQLGTDFREVLGSLKEAVLRLDENIPFFSRIGFYQSGKDQPILKRELLEAYRWLDQWSDVHKNTISIHQSIEDILKRTPRYRRSDYLSVLQFYCGDHSRLNMLTPLQQKRAFEHRDQLMQMDGFETGLKNASFLLNDSYSRMLAKLFTTDFSSPYTEEQKRLLRFSHPSEQSDMYTDSVIPTKSSKCLSWSDVREYITELDRILEANPRIPLDYIIGSMGDPLSIFEVYNKQSEEYLRTTTVDLKTNSGHQVNLQMYTRSGITHLETRGGK